MLNIKQLANERFIILSCKIWSHGCRPGPCPYRTLGLLPRWAMLFKLSESSTLSLEPVSSCVNLLTIDTQNSVLTALSLPWHCNDSSIERTWIFLSSVGRPSFKHSLQEFFMGTTPNCTRYEYQVPPQQRPSSNSNHGHRNQPTTKPKQRPRMLARLNTGSKDPKAKRTKHRA
jgi:hypothetical protein